MSAVADIPTFKTISTTTIAQRVRKVFDDNHAVQLATLGGAWSPWILGAYFARASDTLASPIAPHAGLVDLDLVVMLERSGKTLANIEADPRIAISVSKNDATQDFVQGSGRAVRLADADEAAVIAALTAKMPWYKLYTPCVPVRLELGQLFITSFELGWMPAQQLQLR